MPLQMPVQVFQMRSVSLMRPVHQLSRLPMQTLLCHMPLQMPLQVFQMRSVLQQTHRLFQTLPHDEPLHHLHTAIPDTSSRPQMSLHQTMSLSTIQILLGQMPLTVPQM